MPMSRTADVSSTGARMLSRTPLWRHASSSASVTSLPSRYLSRTSSSASAAASSSWSRRRATSATRSSGRAPRGASLLVQPGPAVDHVDGAREGLTLADGHLERRDLVAELRAQRVNGPHRVGALTVAVGDHEDRGLRQGTAESDGGLRARLGAGRVHGDERRVDRREALDDLAHEVGVAGGVDDA